MPRLGPKRSKRLAFRLAASGHLEPRCVEFLFGLARHDRVTVQKIMTAARRIWCRWFIVLLATLLDYGYSAKGLTMPDPAASRTRTIRHRSPSALAIGRRARNTGWRGITLIALLSTAVFHGVSPVNAAPSELSPEVGYNRGELETPRSAAFGGGLRALSNSLEAVYLNPANMATSRLYHIAGAGVIAPQARRQTYGGGAVDSLLNQQRIAGGVAIAHTSLDPDGLDRKTLDLRFALAMPLSDMIFVGAALKHLTAHQNGYPRSVGLPPSLAAAGLRGDKIWSQVSFDAGVTVKPTSGFSLAIVGTNLTNPELGLAPLTLTGGAGFGTPDFSIELDVGADFTTFQETTVLVMGGGELLVADQFPVRVGYRYDEGTGQQALSGGLGYLSKEFAIEVSARVGVTGPADTAYIFGLRYHLDGAGLVAPLE